MTNMPWLSMIMLTILWLGQSFAPAAAVAWWFTLVLLILSTLGWLVIIVATIIAGDKLLVALKKQSTTVLVLRAFEMCITGICVYLLSALGFTTMSAFLLGFLTLMLILWGSTIALKINR